MRPSLISQVLAWCYRQCLGPDELYSLFYPSLLPALFIHLAGWISPRWPISAARPLFPLFLCFMSTCSAKSEVGSGWQPGVQASAPLPSGSSSILPYHALQLLLKSSRESFQLRAWQIHEGHALVGYKNAAGLTEWLRWEGTRLAQPLAQAGHSGPHLGRFWSCCFEVQLWTQGAFRDHLAQADKSGAGMGISHFVNEMRQD